MSHPLSPPAEARLHYLFRHALRAGQVNPLLHLVPACRAASAP